MGCSNEKVTFELHDGPGLRKETYKGIHSKSSQDEITMTKWYCKYLEWRKQQWISKEKVGEMREWMESEYDKNLKDKRWTKYIEQAFQEKFLIKDSDGNDMEVFMVKSKANKDATDLAPVIHFHGGGGYMGNPEKEVFCNSRIVVENRVAYFSVKYRLGPEVQYPTGHKDAKVAIDYFLENSEKHGCDPNKLCITGESGGGWISMGAAILLAKEDQSKCEKIKLMLLTCPMLGALASSDIPRSEMAKWEEPAWPFRYSDFELHTDDFQKNKMDPLLCPYNLEIEEMKKLPKCVLQTSEFDLILRDVHMIVPKMKEAGIYLDHLDYSGVGHGFQQNADEPKHELWFQDMQQVFSTYLLSE